MDRSLQSAERFWKQSRGLATAMTLVVTAVLYLGWMDGKRLALGFLLGAVASIIRHRLRYRALLRLVQGGAGPTVRAGLFGYALNALALGAAFMFRHVLSPWATIGGLLVMNAATLIVGFLAGDISRAESTSAAGGDG